MNSDDPSPSRHESPSRRLNGADVDEILDRLFASPAVDHDQVVIHVRRRIDSGELRLALAVLEDAVCCALRHHASPIKAQRSAAAEALAWIESDAEARPFDFVRVCQLFDLDPGWIRGRVRRRIEVAPGSQSTSAQRESVAVGRQASSPGRLVASTTSARCAA